MDQIRSRKKGNKHRLKSHCNIMSEKRSESTLSKWFTLIRTHLQEDWWLTTSLHERVWWGEVWDKHWAGPKNCWGRNFTSFLSGWLTSPRFLTIKQEPEGIFWQNQHICTALHRFSHFNSFQQHLSLLSLHQHEQVSWLPLQNKAGPTHLTISPEVIGASDWLVSALTNWLMKCWCDSFSLKC